MITANMVKELREQTGAGMLDCKKALTETNGNMEEAVNWLREKGISKAAKKQTRIAAEGLAAAKVEGNRAVIVEVNSETDFVAKNPEFTSLVDAIATAIMGSDVKNVEEVAAVFDEMTDVIFDVNYKIKYQDIVSDDVMELINKSSEMQVNGDYIPDYSTICVSLWDDGVGNTLNNMVAGKTTVAQAVQTIEPIIKTKIKSMLE